MVCFMLMHLVCVYDRTHASADGGKLFFLLAPQLLGIVPAGVLV